MAPNAFVIGVIEMPAGPRLAIAGAGSIGCFIGGLFLAAGRDVAMLARQRVIDEFDRHGLRLTSYNGFDRHIDTNRLLVREDPAVLADADCVLVTVKSADTAAMADIIAQHAPPHAVIVSLQNGISNVGVLRQRLAGRSVLGGMVPFNVVAMGGGHYHCATSGDVIIERDAVDTAGRLCVPHLTVRPSDDIVGVQNGKLLLNLNNALNALSGLTLREQLALRAWRRLFADMLGEALAAMKAEGLRPVSATPIPVTMMPFLLRLPDGVFNLLLGRVMKIDPAARSSMYEDLQRGRKTEIDYLQGAILEMAARHHTRAVLTERISKLIKEAERSGQGSPGLAPEQIHP